MKTHSKVMSEILEISENSYFRWKKKDHQILINLIEKYFTKEDLLEFLETQKIEKFEINKIIESTQIQICNSFFYTSYTKQPINREFHDFIFPNFEKYLEHKNEKKRNFLKNYSIFRHCKPYLLEFIVDLDEFKSDEKVEYIQKISKLSEFELSLLLLHYKHLNF